MAVKTFAVGELATAADVNQYLANAGIVYVGTYTGGNGVATYSPGVVFSAEYDNYMVRVTGGTVATGTTLRMRLGSSSSGYYAGYALTNWGTGGGVLGGADSNATYWTQVGYSAPTNGTDAVIDLRWPFLAQRSRMSTSYAQLGTTSTLGGVQGAGFHNVSTSYDTFTLSTASAANWTSDLTVTVYGYRKP